EQVNNKFGSGGDRMRLSRFWVLAAVQAILVFVGSCVWFSRSTKSYLANPPPDADAFTLSRDFQFMVFVLLGMPMILLAIQFLVGAEYLALVLYRRVAARGKARVEPGGTPGSSGTVV